MLLVEHNVIVAPTKFVIDEIWKEIYEKDNWKPLNDFLSLMKM